MVAAEGSWPEGTFRPHLTTIGGILISLNAVISVFGVVYGLG
jgi:hypothetical protein